MKSQGSRSKSRTRPLPPQRPRRLQRLNQKAATYWPGIKTRVTAGCGIIGSAAALLQNYVSGLPLDKIIDVKTVLIINVVLFSLAYWFRSLTNVEHT